MTTVQETTSKIVALDIQGLKTAKEFPPTVVSSAQLPYLYIRSLETGIDTETLSFAGGLQYVDGEIVILVGVSRQNTTEELYRQTRSFMDKLQTALENEASNLKLSTWSIKEEFEAVDTNSYFIVLCNFRCV